MKVKIFSMKGASWDSMFLAVSRVLTIIYSILSTKILSVGLTLTEYGTYSQANLISTVGTSLIALGLVDALNYFFNKQHEDIDQIKRNRLVNTVFFLEICLGVVFYIVVMFCAKAIASYFSNAEVMRLLPIVALLPALGNLCYFYSVLCVSVKKAKLMATYNILALVVKILSVYFAVYVFNNLIWIYVVLLLLDLVHLLVYNLIMLKNNVKINPFDILPSYIGKILAYSLPMGIYVITSSLTRDLDKMIIARLGDTESLAVYTNCSKVLPLDFLAVAFATVLIPYIIRCVTEKNEEKTVSLFSLYLKVGYYSVWILGTMVLISPSTMVSFLYSDEYLSGVSIFVLYVLDSMLRFASMHLILTAANKAKTLMGYSIFSLILNFILNIILYNMFGLVGPAIATLIVAVIYSILIINKTIGVINAKWSKVFDLKEILLFVFSLIVLWGILFFLNNFIVQLGLNKYVTMILCMVAFGVLQLVLHFKKIFAILKEINNFR